MNAYSYLDLSQIRVFPLASRKSLTTVDSIEVDPDSPAPSCPEKVRLQIEDAADAIRSARARGAAVILIYGAHLLRNGAANILDRLMAQKWLTHLATNGAGSIHDWEYAFLGKSTESVEENVATGTFGTWDETGRCIHLALLAGGLRNEGYGQSLGRFIQEDGTDLPSPNELKSWIQAAPEDPLTAARADLLGTMLRHKISGGRILVKHPFKAASIFGRAFAHGIPLSVHPGIGYDIISNHPMFHGAAIGRAAARDFALFGSAVDHLDGGVVLSVGSAIMGPQVFEKSISCANNIRIQNGRPTVHDHKIFVVDIQEGGQWDWRKGEPPKTNPAYYLRFCKSYARMGGDMQYVRSDNLAFVHQLYHQLQST